MARAALGDYRGAEAAFRQALAVGATHGLLHMRLGLALGAQGRHEEAVGALRHAERKSPVDTEVQLNLGNALAQSGRAEEALACYHKVLALQPDHAAAHYNLGNFHRNNGKWEEAAASYRQALALAPEDPDACNNLGVVYEQLGRVDEAIACYRKCLASEPEHADAHNNLASALRAQRRFDEAVVCCRRALEIRPGFVDALLNLAALRGEQGKFAEALGLYKKALGSAPDDSDVRSNYAMLCLAMGEFEEGWRNYQWRRPRLEALRAGRIPRMRRPGSVAGKSVLLLGEQGIGDELFFLRFAPALREQGASLLCQCHRKLKDVLQRTGFFDLVVAHEESAPASELSLLVGDLPLIALEIGGPVLAPPLKLGVLEAKAASVRGRLGRLGPPPYVGLTWRAGTPLAAQRFRGQLLLKEVPLERLARALQSLPGTVLALQLRPGREELDCLRRELKREIHDLSDANDDLEDMIALLVQIHEYVGVSNTNMHLMAGLGRTARVLVPHPPDWRWMVRQHESPWFPGFATYRQRVDGDWLVTLGRLADDLRGSLTSRLHG